MESQLKYFPEGNYEKFLQIKKVVKTACSSRGGPDGDYVRSTERNGMFEKGNRKGSDENIPESLVEDSISARSFNDWNGHSGRIMSFPKDNLDKAQARLELGRSLRRTTSAAWDGTTIASRNKIRPEPKFQRAASSHILSKIRKDSHIISKNPERFLQGIVDGEQPIQTSSSINFTEQLKNTDSFSSLLSSFNQDAQTYRKTLTNLKEICKQTKSRALLLNLGSNPVIRSKLNDKSNCSSSRSRSSVASDLSSYFAGEADAVLPVDVGGGGDNPDFVLQTFLDEIRWANVSGIVTWVKTIATLNDYDLPFGIPANDLLRIPLGNQNQDQAFSTFTRCSVEFIKSGMEEFFLLDAEYHAKLEELKVKIIDNFRNLELAGWADKDSALLFYLMNLTAKSSGSFSGEKLCTEVASRIFPLYGREEIIEQKYKLKVKKGLEEKRDSLIKQWLKDKESLVKKVNSAWDDIQKKERLNLDFQNERRIQQDKCQYWTDLLEKMRRENRKRVRAVELIMEPIEEEMKSRQRLKEEHEKNRRLHQKDLVEKFQKLKIENIEEQKKRQEEIQAVLEKDKKIRQIHNRSRVHFRKKEYEQKVETMKELERKREEGKRTRLELLEKTKEKVDVPYNPAHVLSDTHASLVRSIEIQQLIQFRDGDAQKAVKFFQERYSFSAETLWKDSRVRLEAKLREAGLLDNSYAKTVLSAMQPKEKPHLLSQIKFDYKQ